MVTEILRDRQTDRRTDGQTVRRTDIKLLCIIDYKLKLNFSMYSNFFLECNWCHFTGCWYFYTKVRVCHKNGMLYTPGGLKALVAHNVETISNSPFFSLKKIYVGGKFFLVVI